MTIRYWIAVVAAAVVAACGEAAAVPEARSIPKVTSTATPAWAAGDCTRTTKPKFDGEEPAEIVRRFGPPAVDRRFRMGDESNPFNIELRNIFTLPANRDRTIREMMWSHGSCRLTVWSADRGSGWRAVMAVRWDTQTDF